MTPISRIKISSLPDIEGLAIVRKVGRRGGDFLITGGAEQYACLLDEKHDFRAFLSKGGANWQGVTIEGVELEVDLGSCYDVGEFGHVPGSIVFKGSSSYFAAFLSGQFSGDIELIPLTDKSALPAPVGYSDQVGFRCWRAVVRLDGKNETVFEKVDASL